MKVLTIVALDFPSFGRQTWVRIFAPAWEHAQQTPAFARIAVEVRRCDGKARLPGGRSPPILAEHESRRYLDGLANTISMRGDRPITIGVRPPDDKDEMNPCRKRMRITLAMPLGRWGTAR